MQYSCSHKLKFNIIIPRDSFSRNKIQKQPSVNRITRPEYLHYLILQKPHEDEIDQTKRDNAYETKPFYPIYSLFNSALAASESFIQNWNHEEQCPIQIVHFLHSQFMAAALSSFSSQLGKNGSEIFF